MVIIGLFLIMLAGLITGYPIVLIKKGEQGRVTDMFMEKKLYFIITSAVLALLGIALIVVFFVKAPNDKDKEIERIKQEQKLEKEGKSNQTDEELENQDKTKISDRLKKRDVEEDDSLETTEMTKQEKEKADMISNADENSLADSISSDPSKKFFVVETKLNPYENYKESQTFTDKEPKRQMSYGKGIWKGTLSYFVKEVGLSGEPQIKIYPANYVSVKSDLTKDMDASIIKYYEVVQTGIKDNEPILMKKLRKLQINVPNDTKIIDMDLDNGQVQNTNTKDTKQKEEKVKSGDNKIENKENAKK